MKKFTTIITAFAIVISSFAFNASSAHACSCMMPKPPQEALADSTAVFQGTVTSIDEGAKVDGFATSFIATFDVETSWKGINSDTVEISTARDSAACGVNFEVGKTYVVYANDQEDGSLSTNLCSRTHEVMDATTDEDIAALGTTTLPITPAESDDSSEYPYRRMILMLGTVVVIGAAYFAARKKISSEIPPTE